MALRNVAVSFWWMTAILKKQSILMSLYTPDDRSAILKPSESTAIVFILDNEGKKNSSILFSGLFFVVVKLHWLVLKDQVM